MTAPTPEPGALAGEQTEGPEDLDAVERRARALAVLRAATHRPFRRPAPLGNAWPTDEAEDARVWTRVDE